MIEIENLKYLAYNKIGSTLDTLLCGEILRNVLLLNFFASKIFN